jgi:DedD protein
MSESFDGEDKSVVEFQLGNKQLFFLFIGLLVIGAIIFFIGLRVGADSAKSKVALNLGAEEQQASANPGGEKLDEQELDVRPGIKPSTEKENKKKSADNKSVQLNMKDNNPEVVKAKDLPKTEKPRNKKKNTANSNKKTTTNQKSADTASKKAEAEKPKTSTAASGKYYVQIAAPTNKARAQKMISKLPAGRNGEIMEKTVKGKVYYRVLVGPYKSKADAEAARQVLNKSYKGAYIQIKK